MEFVAGASLGYLIHNTFGARYAGEKAFGMMKFKTFEGGYIHVHHWMIYLVILTIITLSPRTFVSEFVGGFCVGGIIQGLTYPDWYCIRVAS